MGAMQTPVLVLMNNPASISQFDIRFEQPTQFIQRYSISDYIFKGLHKFLAHLVIIEFVHTEHDSASHEKEVIISSPFTNQNERVIPFPIK